MTGNTPQDADRAAHTLGLANLGLFDLSDRERERLTDELADAADGLEPEIHNSPGIKWETRRLQNVVDHESGADREYVAHE